jgi:molybdopterin-guanine dinucleotide biosynthesis protein A
MRDSCDEIWILGRPGVAAEKYHAEIPEARLRVDVKVQAGPLAALREALKQGRSDFVVVAPCDAPALKKEDVELLITTARKEKSASVAVSNGSTLFDLFCSPRTILEERLKTAKRLEDLVKEAKPVPFAHDGLNVNEPMGGPKA